MLKWLVRILSGLAAVLAAIVVANASFWATPPNHPQIRLIAHRGVHQTFSRENITADTCTASRIYEPNHGYLENTVESAQAAFALGADIVEFDIHPTTDGMLAVFHDWTLECRTNGQGVVREADLATLQTLDIGYGYTADDGASFPFRGQFVGQMPELADMLGISSGGQFLVNFKSRDSYEADMLAERLAANPEWRTRIWSAYGGQEPSDRLNTLVDGLNAYGSKQVQRCLITYLALGWTGHVPAECRNTKINVPINVAWMMWGWPDRFQQRMKEAGSEIILLGPIDLGDVGTSGIDDAATLAQVPNSFDGYVWTNRIELIGPIVKIENSN